MQSATKQIRAVSSNGNGDVTFPLQESLPSWRERFLAFAAKVSPTNWERITVNKNIDSVTMPKWVAVCVLGAFLAFMGQSWWARSSDHDAMIRIETKLEAATNAADKAEAEQKARNGDMQAWRETMNGSLKEIKGMLTQAQVDALKQAERKQGAN